MVLGASPFLKVRGREGGRRERYLAENAEEGQHGLFADVRVCVCQELLHLEEGDGVGRGVNEREIALYGVWFG